MTTISVVIPTCDRPDYLVEAVTCVLEQTRPADEIIVVNNGRAPLDTDLLPKQVTIHEMSPYVGASRARNQGVDLATGDYVAFLDDDDLWELDYLRKVSQIIMDQQPDCIITRLDKLVDGQVHSFKNADGKIDLATLFVRNPGVVGPTTIVRQHSFRHVSGYDYTLTTSEDKALIIELLLHNCSVVTAPHIQAIMRVHHDLRLTNAETMQKGISRFVQKYGKQMSFAQRNFNWLKVYYYRYLTDQRRFDYYFYWFHLRVHNFLRNRNETLPAAPNLP